MYVRVVQKKVAPIFTRQSLSVAPWGIKPPKKISVQLHQEASTHTTSISFFECPFFDQKLLIYIPKTMLVKYKWANGIYCLILALTC